MGVQRKIIFYRTASGQNPVEDFLDQLPPKTAQKVTWVLQLIEDLNKVPSKYFKKLVNTQDLWEVRASAGSNIFRLIGFFDGPKIVVVAHGFQKKTQKTPKRAIQIAHERKREYFRRKTK